MNFIYLFIYPANYLVSVCLSLFNYKIEKKNLATAIYSVLGNTN